MHYFKILMHYFKILMHYLKILNDYCAKLAPSSNLQPLTLNL